MGRPLGLLPADCVNPKLPPACSQQQLLNSSVSKTVPRNVVLFAEHCISTAPNAVGKTYRLRPTQWAGHTQTGNCGETSCIACKTCSSVMRRAHRHGHCRHASCYLSAHGPAGCPSSAGAWQLLGRRRPACRQSQPWTLHSRSAHSDPGMHAQGSTWAADSDQQSCRLFHLAGLAGCR